MPVTFKNAVQADNAYRALSPALRGYVRQSRNQATVLRVRYRALPHPPVPCGPVSTHLAWQAPATTGVDPKKRRIDERGLVVGGRIIHHERRDIIRALGCSARTTASSKGMTIDLGPHCAPPSRGLHVAALARSMLASSPGSIPRC